MRAAKSTTIRGGPRAAFFAITEDLGPGLVTGAADDDPSGIPTYSQAGAQFGYGLLWTMVFSYPLMASIQLVSAHIGRVTGRGLASNFAAEARGAAVARAKTDDISGFPYSPVPAAAAAAGVRFSEDRAPNGKENCV